MYRKLALLCALFCSSLHLSAHEMTPSHPQLRPAHIAGLQVTSLRLFNRRQDVEWYEVGVFDEDRRPIPFVSSYKVFRVPYLDSVNVDVYLRNKDVNRVVYICSRSKLRAEKSTYALVSSVICSRVKQ